MRRFIPVVLVILLPLAAFALEPQGKSKTIQMQQGGFCYLTEPPVFVTVGDQQVPQKMVIHAITAGVASDGVGRMRADMWQTMWFNPDGTVTLSDGRFIFTFFEALAEGNPSVLQGTYEGTGPAPDQQFGAASLTANLRVTGGTGQFSGAKGNGVVKGNAIMQPPVDTGWFAPLAFFGIDNDFMGGMIPMQGTPTCAFQGSVKVELNQ